MLILVWFERYLLPAQFTERHNWYKGHAFALAVTGCSGANGLIAVLKEQCPVTAHAPIFDFWTGYREIKRCEESKRTLKNPFASRLAEFSTTVKLLRITDQRYIVLVKFRFGPNLEFLALLLLTLAGGPKDGKRFDAD